MSTKRPNNAGKKWTDLDQCQLLDLLETENSLENIALKLERSVGAVKTRLLKETYDLLTQGDWTVEELATRYKLSEDEISNYQQREDYKKMNPPDKRVTRSQTNQDNANNQKTFSSVTKTRQVLTPNNDKEVILPQTYEEKSLALLTEMRDLLRIIASKK